LISTPTNILLMNFPSSSSNTFLTVLSDIFFFKFKPNDMILLINK
jgi:hypothetical protein